MRNTEQGFTLVEVAVAGAILTVGLLGFVAALSKTIEMDSRTNETVMAMRAAQDVIDEMWDLSRQDYWAVHDSYNGTDFDVEGLIPAGDRSAVGQVFIYDNEAAAKAALASSADIDLDRNGTANENMSKAPSQLRFLPVRVRVQWETPFGTRTHDLHTIIYNREES